MLLQRRCGDVVAALRCCCSGAAALLWGHCGAVAAAHRRCGDVGAACCKGAAAILWRHCDAVAAALVKNWNGLLRNFVRFDLLRDVFVHCVGVLVCVWLRVGLSC